MLSLAVCGAEDENDVREMKMSARVCGVEEKLVTLIK